MSEDFLTELRNQYDRLIHLKERLDNKANNMIAMSGTISTLFMGFGIFLLNQIESPNPLLASLAIVSLILEVIFTSITIKYCVDAYRLRHYQYPIGYETFFNGDEIDQKNVQLFAGATPAQLHQHFTNEYLKGIKENQVAIAEKSGLIENAQRSFLGAVTIMPIFTALVIATYLLRGS